LIGVFSDIDELAQECRFGDCPRPGEPGCAVVGGDRIGRAAAARLDSWVKLRREAEWIASRTDARLRSERTAMEDHPQGKCAAPGATALVS